MFLLKSMHFTMVFNVYKLKLWNRSKTYKNPDENLDVKSKGLGFCQMFLISKKKPIGLWERNPCIGYSLRMKNLWKIYRLYLLLCDFCTSFLLYSFLFFFALSLSPSLLNSNKESNRFLRKCRNCSFFCKGRLVSVLGLIWGFL